MLISSMDQLNYYSMPKDGYLEIDTSAGGYSLGQQTLDEGSPTYLNEENSPKNGTKSSLYKTELCKRFSEFGSCRYGAKCQFAHGLAELRHVVRHPKYKTTKCKSYWGSGHCPYGSRCRFIHEEAESMTPPPFSPPSSMSGMFFHENSNDGLGVTSPSGTGGFLYGGSSHMNGSSYQKDYSLLGSFNNDAVSMPWGSAPTARPQQSPLSYADRGVPAPAVIPGANGAASINGAAYPDLQDAIDALMRFSLSPAEAEAQAVAAMSASNGAAPRSGGLSGVAPLGTITTTPGVSTATADAGISSSTAASKDYSLDSDELWKDFPTLSASSVGDFGADKQWPTGLSLSLEGTGLFSSSSTSTSSSSTSAPSTATTVEKTESPKQPATAETASPGKKDETSPRLSVFERFH